MSHIDIYHQFSGSFKCLVVTIRLYMDTTEIHQADHTKRKEYLIICLA